MIPPGLSTAQPSKFRFVYWHSWRSRTVGDRCHTFSHCFWTNQSLKNAHPRVSSCLSLVQYPCYQACTHKLAALPKLQTTSCKICELSLSFLHLMEGLHNFFLIKWQLRLHVFFCNCASHLQQSICQCRLSCSRLGFCARFYAQKPMHTWSWKRDEVELPLNKKLCLFLKFFPSNMGYYLLVIIFLSSQYSEALFVGSFIFSIILLFSGLESFCIPFIVSSVPEKTPSSKRENTPSSNKHQQPIIQRLPLTTGHRYSEAPWSMCAMMEKFRICDTGELPGFKADRATGAPRLLSVLLMSQT